MNNHNTLLTRALQARKVEKIEIVAKREQAKREWIGRAVGKTIEAAKTALEIELDADDIEVQFARRNQAIQCTFSVFGEPVDLHFRTFTEESAYDYVKAELELTIGDEMVRIHNLAGLGAELERRGFSDPTLAPEADSGA